MSAYSTPCQGCSTTTTGEVCLLDHDPSGNAFEVIHFKCPSCGMGWNSLVPLVPGDEDPLPGDMAEAAAQGIDLCSLASVARHTHAAQRERFEVDMELCSEKPADWEDMDHHYCVCGERPECGKRPRFFLWRWLTGTPKQ